MAKPKVFVTRLMAQEALDKVARDWFVSRSGLKSAWYRAGYRGG